MSLSNLLDRIREVEGWFKDQALRQTHSTVDSIERTDDLRRRMDAESSALVKYGHLNKDGLVSLRDTAIRGVIPNEDWNKLKTLVDSASRAEAAAASRLAEESGVTPIPPEVASRTEDRYQIAAKAINEEAELALRGPRSRAPNAGLQVDAVGPILEIEMARTEKLLQVRLDALMESLGLLGRRLTPFTDWAEKDLEGLVSARQRAVIGELERRARAVGNRSDGSAMAAIAEFKRNAEAAFVHFKRKFALAAEDESRTPLTTNGWRELSPDQIDVLVPLASKKAYLADVQAATSESSGGDPLCLLVVDVDDFKTVNENFLHSGGDRALIAVAETLASVSKGKGKAYRWGGDEFVVLLPNLDISEARATAERARTEIEMLKFEEAGFRVSVTVGGAVTTNAQALGADRLFKIADSALLAQKKIRKNQVAIEST